MIYLLRINLARKLTGAYRNVANVVTGCPRIINASTVSSKRSV